MASVQVHHREPCDQGSSDVLFPEDDPRGLADQTCYSEDSFYSAPSTVYSGYSQDAKYLFEPELYAQPHQHRHHHSDRHHQQQQQQQSYTDNNNKPRNFHNNNNNYTEIDLVSKHASPRLRQEHHTPQQHHTSQQQQQHNTRPTNSDHSSFSDRESYSHRGDKPAAPSGRAHGTRAFGQALRTSYGKFSSRRRTWSPPTCARVMAAVENFGILRTCNSNEQLDIDEDGASSYQGDRAAPPRLAPISGVPSKVIF